MDENGLRGLALALGHRIADRPRGEGALLRLREMDDPREIPSFLASLPLPHDARVVEALAAWLAADWPARKADLLKSAERSRIERMAPGI